MVVKSDKKGSYRRRQFVETPAKSADRQRMGESEIGSSTSIYWDHFSGWFAAFDFF